MSNVLPNILLIVSEDNGPHLGCYGDLFVDTPHLDRLASEGVRFTNAYTTQAVCSPGRASILTGLYPHQNGQIGLATHKYAMYEPFPNLVSLAKAAGYRTGLIGKLHVNPESAFPLDFWWNDKAFISFANRDVHKIAEVAEDFITSGEAPFLLMISYPDAHLPFLREQFGVPQMPYEAEDVRPLPFVGTDTPRLRQHTADYYNCLSRLDTGVGLVLDCLKRAQKEQETLVIFTTDHGAQFSRGKTTIYEGGLRVPFIVKWPDRLAAGEVREELVSHVDILPTLVEAAGINGGDETTGRSLMPLLRGEQVPWRDHLFAEWCSGGPLIYFPQRSVRDRRYKLIVTLLQDRPSPCALGYSGPGQQWEPGTTVDEIAAADDNVRTVYTIFRNPPPIELYDLENDPWEFTNLAGNPAYVAVVDRLHARLRSWQKATGDALADPARLQRLTQENDAIVSKHYQESIYGNRQDFHWHYAEYLHIQPD